MTVRLPIRSLAACALVLFGTSACAGPGQASSSAATPGHDKVVVFAAASLTGTFDEIAHNYEAAHPGTEVTISYAGSTDLVSQIAAGAPADVLATADERTMKQASDQKLVPQSSVFATNELEILVAPGNPQHIAGARDLSRPGLSVVVCAPQVPCGAATRRTLDAAGISTKPVSEEPNVTSTAGQVSSGQADAAVVYATDVARAQAAHNGTGVPLGVDQVANRYPIGVTAHAQDAAKGGDPAGEAHAQDAQDFVAYVQGPEGRAVLQRAGFGTP